MSQHQDNPFGRGCILSQRSPKELILPQKWTWVLKFPSFLFC